MLAESKAVVEENFVGNQHLVQQHGGLYPEMYCVPFGIEKVQQKYTPMP